MRILGVDPGLVALGYGVLENGKTCKSLHFGCLKLSSKSDLASRLKRIYDEICHVISEYNPDEFAIEDIYYAENAKVAIKLGHARGVAILAAVNNHIPTSEYSPREVKQSVVGNGAASKQQVQAMVQRLLQLRDLPQPYDASDALAVALCHLHRRDSKI